MALFSHLSVEETRSLMGGNEGGNSGISEFISLILEPLAREQECNMEINATNGLLADIKDLNDELEVEKKTLESSTREEHLPIPQEDCSSRDEEMVSQPNQVPSRVEPTGHTAGGEQTGHYPSSPCGSQMDIRLFLMDGKEKPSPEKLASKNITFINNLVVEEPLDKMRMIRKKWLRQGWQWKEILL